MAQKIYVRAVSPNGLPTRSRAGRHWPTDKHVEVEVVDGDEEPTLSDGRLDPGKITKKALKALESDPQISIRQTAESDANLAKENQELRAQVADLQRQLGQGGGTATQASRAGEGDSGEERSGRTRSR